MEIEMNIDDNAELNFTEWLSMFVKILRFDKNAN